MPYDYSEASPPRDVELIPHGTIATVQMRIRPGDAGEDGLLKRSARGDCEMLNLEFVVVDGPYARRKFWENMILAGTTDGHAKAAEISRGRLRTIIESARGIKPDDLTPQARAARTAALKDFDSLSFIAKIGVEKGKPKNDGTGESYADRNVLAGVITPDRKEWHPVPQPPPWNGGGSETAAPVAPASGGIAKPSWAT
jgi:hypothetical protein